MKLKKSDFFMDVGRFQTIVSVVIILLYFIDGLYGLFFKGNLKNLLENKMILVVFVVFFISSLWYLCKFSNNRNYNSNSKDYIKLVSLIREINYTLSLVIIWIGIEILAKFLIDIPELLTSIIVLLILIRFYISILGILLGLRKLVLLLIIPLMVIVIYIIGLFDISFWALVSSLLVIWNFVNSEEILVLLSKGKEINHIPKSWRYVWKRNKIASYVITTYVYLALIISKYFESEGMSVLDRANIRVNTLSLLMLGLVCICIIYHGLKHLWNNNKKIRDCLSNKLRVSPFIQIVSFFNFFKQYKIFVNYNKKEKK